MLQSLPMIIAKSKWIPFEMKTVVTANQSRKSKMAANQGGPNCHSLPIYVVCVVEKEME
jgi:hypothetical protein